MKRIFLLLSLLSLLALTSYSQVSNQITSLYDLRLRMTIGEMKRVVDTSLLKEDLEPRVIAAFKNKKFEGRLASFHLREYVVDEYHSLRDVRLSFLDNALYMIEVYEFNSDTETYLTERYGKPNTEVVVEAEKSKYNREHYYMWVTQDWKLDVGQVLNCTSGIYLDRNLRVTKYLFMLLDVKRYLSEVK